MSTENTSRLIVVCVPTFRRNDMLRDCLAGIGRLAVPDGCRVEVVVADNDMDGGAREVVEAARGTLPFPLHYCQEAERGVASIRNRLVEEALRLGADWLALIDDDEVPEPAWLAEHWKAIARFGADVSSGPALPAGGPDAEDAARRLQRRETGTTPRHVATNNVVFRRALVADQGLRFDTRFNLIGGVDFDFFDRSRALGNVHVWVAEARVFETIPPERATWRYLFWRHYSGAINAVARFRKQHSAAHAWLHFGIKALGKLLGALWALACAVLRPRDSLRAAVKRVANAAGYLAALLGLNAERYR